MNKRFKKAKPLMIALGGKSGSGKTTVAYELAKQIENAVVVDADVVRKQMFQAHPTARLPDKAYSPEAHARFMRHLRREQRHAMQNHAVVIVTGIFLDQNSRMKQEEFAQECGGEFQAFWIKASIRTLFSRVSLRSTGPSISDADTRVLRRQSKTLRREDIKSINWPLVNGDQPIKDVIEDIKELLHDNLAHIPATKAKIAPINRFF